jgi:hypothetical protein
MAYARYCTIESFRTLNPDELITLYTSKSDTGSAWTTGQQQDFSHYAGDDWRPGLAALGVNVIEWDCPVPATPNQQADLCRWWVLAQGGMFADMDIVFFRPLTDAHRKILSGTSLTCEAGIVSLGLTGSGGSSMYADIYEHALTLCTPKRYQAAGVEVIYDLLHGEKAWRNDLPDWAYLGNQDSLKLLDERYGVTNIPKRWVHPVAIEQVFAPGDLDELEDDVLGIHWYAGAPVARQVVERWTPQTPPPGITGQAVRRSA